MYKYEAVLRNGIEYTFTGKWRTVTRPKMYTRGLTREEIKEYMNMLEGKKGDFEKALREERIIKELEFEVEIVEKKLFRNKTTKCWKNEKAFDIVRNWIPEIEEFNCNDQNR